MSHSKFMEIQYIYSYIWFVLMDSRSQFLTSHAIFNCCAYAEQVDRIIFYTFSSFSIRDVGFQSTFPTPQALKPNTCNNYFETNLATANLTKTSFGNGGHCSATIINLSHLIWALARTWLITFWSFRLYTAMASPNMRAFILAWSWCWGPLSQVEGFPGLTFSTTKPCTSFKCLVNNHLAQYVTMQVPPLHFHFNPTFVHYLSFRATLSGQGGVSG